MTEALLPGERIDNLQLARLRVIQRADAFCFGMDTVLLADFARVRRNDLVCDLGAGTGALSILLYGREPSARFDMVELQPDIADMARRSVLMNQLESSMTVHALDVRDAYRALAGGAYDLAVCNPPFFARTGGMCSENPALRKARHEDATPFAEFAHAAERLLKNGGRFACVFPASRTLEMCDVLRAYRIEPKRLRFVHSDAEKAPYAVLMEGVLNARPGLHPEPPLIIRDARGEYSAEYRRIYHMESE